MNPAIGKLVASILRGHASAFTLVRVPHDLTAEQRREICVAFDEWAKGSECSYASLDTFAEKYDSSVALWLADLVDMQVQIGELKKQIERLTLWT